MKITRRTFFKKSAKATAAFSIAPSVLAEGATETKPIKIRQNFESNADNKSVIASARIFKKAQLSPGAVIAGDNAEFIIKLTVGKEYTPSASRIIFDFPATLGQSRPALMHHEDFGYMEVYVSNPDVTYVKRLWDMELSDFASKKKQSWRGAGQRIFVLDLSGGLKTGDIIEVHWGDNQAGFGPGTNVTCVVPKADYENRIDVRYFDSPQKGLPDMGRSYKGYDRSVPDFELGLKFKISPREPHHLRVIRKLDKALLIPNDRYWNVADVKDASSLVKASAKATKNNSGVFEYSNKNVNIVSKALPLFDTADMGNAFEGMNVYWGELHNHSTFSIDVVERERAEMSPDDLMRYARETAGLDFFSVSDHHQPWDDERHKIGKKNWDETIEAVRAHNKNGEFVVFPGFEFRCPRGDTVITFGWHPKYAEIDKPEWQTIQNMWAGLKGKDYLTQPHFHNAGKLKKGQWWQSPETKAEPTIEIFSCHGSYERKDALENGRAMIKRFRKDRCGAYFISKGYKYGFAGNSDGHKGHVGLNGLTAVFAKKLDRESIFEAYRKRHIYCTTNARIRLVFTSNGKLMGSAIPNSKEKVFLVDVVGENNLKKIDLFKNGTHYKRFTPTGKTFKKEFAIKDEQPSNWYVRVTQLDNHIAYSSPVWFE